MTRIAHRRLLLLCACCALPSWLIAQQSPARDRAGAAPTGTAMVSGTVSTDETPGRPVRRASVTLARADQTGETASVMAVTDDSGRFSFRNLPAGRYTLGASRQGMIATSYGARRPGRPGTALTITDGQQLTNVALRITRGAVITGTIRDQLGQPASGIRVSVMRYSFSAQTGEKTLMSTSGLGVATDDRGVYRAFGLPPDDYVVVATVGIGPRVGNDLHQVTAAEVQWAMRQIDQPGQYVPPPTALSSTGIFAPVFFPGTTLQTSAATVSVGPGEERTGVDITLQLVPTSKITGTIVTPPGTPVEGWQIAILAHNRVSGLPFAGFGTASPNKDGQFSFAGVTPGTYTLTARLSPTARGRGAGAPASTSLFGLVDVAVVEGRDTDITLPIRTGVTVSGQIVFDGTSPPPSNLTSVSVAMNTVQTGNSASLGVGSVKADARGQFTFTGVAPGRYLMSSFDGSSSLGTWRLRSAMLQGHDALDTPLDVATNDVDGLVLTFTDRQTELTGVLSDPAGRPAPEYFVIVFAADTSFWTPQSRRIQQVRPGVDGKFIVRNLPPGEYLLGAVTDVEQGEWFDPSFLQQLVASSARVTLTDGEKKTQDIRIAK